MNEFRRERYNTVCKLNADNSTLLTPLPICFSNIFIPVSDQKSDRKFLPIDFRDVRSKIWCQIHHFWHILTLDHNKSNYLLNLNFGPQNGTSGQTSSLKPVWKYWKNKLEGGSAMSNRTKNASKCPKIAKNTQCGHEWPHMHLGVNIKNLGTSFWLKSPVNGP